MRMSTERCMSLEKQAERSWAMAGASVGAESHRFGQPDFRTTMVVRRQLNFQEEE